MFKKFALIVFVICGVYAHALSVQRPSSPITVDGKLDEAAWQNATRHGNFARMKSQAGKPLKDQTEFSVLADDEAVYLGIRCFDSDMANVAWNGNIWGSDAIEMFISPVGNPIEYYHFGVSCSNARYNMFFAEAGTIRPDSNFAPFWASATSKDDKAWYLEVRIPYSAFYMTRTRMWSSKWLLNITRTQTHGGGLSTWSPLKDSFHESKVFRAIDGFPKRREIEDVYIPVVVGDFTSLNGNTIKGDLVVNIEGNNAYTGIWDMTVEVPGGSTVKMPVEIDYGNNKFQVKDLDFPASEQRSHKVKVTLKKGDVELGRYFPVAAEYKPIDIKLTWPQYANNYYPGQDASRIAGKIRYKVAPKDIGNSYVELKIGDKTRKYGLSKGEITFEHKMKELAEGEKLDLTARLVTGGKEVARKEIWARRLASPAKGGDVVWIQDGHLVRNGKPYFMRGIYSPGYRGGTRIADIFEKQKDYVCVNEALTFTLEPMRLCPDMNIEAKEATKDVKPCQKLFDQVAKVIEKNRGKNFLGYYISDEPECRSISPIYLKHIYDFVKEKDPYHPVFSCTRAPMRYMDCVDVFMMHTYISPMFSGNERFLAVPVEKVREQIREVADLNRPDKVAGFTGQLYSYKTRNKYADYPTWDELQAQTWTALANGSKVNYPFVYHDVYDRSYMFEAFAYHNQCIMELEDWFLSPKVSYLNIQADKKPDCTLFENAGVKLLVMVNLFPEPVTARLADSRINGTWHEFRGDAVLKLRSNAEISFAPYQVYVLSSKPIKSSFQPLKEVIAKFKADESQVLGKGNLLLNKGDEIEMDASEVDLLAFAKKKICDGGTKMLAWGSNNYKKQQWFEMDFPKVSPLFKKIKIYGHNLKNPSFQIWKAGDWKELKPTETQEDVQEWSKSFTFDKPYKTVKLRVSFSDLVPGKDSVEIYEIEMYK